MMTKVTPTATISAGDAATKIRAKLRIDRNLGSINAKMAQRTISTRSGAHFTKVSRPMENLAVAVLVVSVVAKVLPPKSAQVSPVRRHLKDLPAGRMLGWP
ncbi:MAG: hypothetical protein HQ495_16305 [Alphaproteobacteria bacterium]|nr:hypothetical protein [Alphaproteobacteria bacterium]